MGAKLRVLRRRIRGVQSTKKITSAMELIAASQIRRAEQLVRTLRDEGKDAKLYVTGRKAQSYFRFRQRQVEETWTGFSERPSYDDAKEVADAMIKAFVEREVDEIHAVYTHF